HAAVLVVKCVYRGLAIDLAVAQRIANGGQCEPRVESGRRVHQLAVRPQTESMGCKFFPGEILSRIAPAGRGHVLMADDLRARNMPAIGEMSQQTQQAVDLGLRKRLVAVVLELDPDGRGV